MKADRHRERLLRDLCAEVHEDDGVRIERRPQREGSTRGRHKQEQLCRQVERAVSYALAATGGRQGAPDLVVVGADPAPDTGRFRITVVHRQARDEADLHAAIAWLAGLAGLLRCEVAAAITRKRVPELVFDVTFPEEAGDAEG